MDSKPITSIQEFIDRDAKEQFSFQEDYKETNFGLLNGDEWPRVEELELDDDDNDRVGDLNGIISPGSKDLKALSDLVSKISCTLRLDSQKDGVLLVSNDSTSQTLKEDNVFMTSVPKQVYQKRLNFSYFHNSKVVEATKYLGFDSDSKKLPNDVDTKSLLKKGAFKIKNSEIYKWKIPKKWLKLCCNESSIQIVSDSFWYIWHHHYSPNQELEKQLLSRISSVFVSFFLNCLLSSHSKDEFFKIYPNILAMAVWSGFMESFPKSQQQFGISFQIIVCDFVAEWIMGIVPAAPWCLDWESHEPITSFKADVSRTDKPQNTQNPELNMFAAKPDQGENVEKKERESCQMGPSFKIVKNRFDVYQNSPVISKYLSSAGYHKNHGSIIVHRSQVIRKPTDPNVPTYRQIISESLKNASLHFQEYKEKIKIASKEKLSIIQETNASLSKDQSQHLKIINSPRLVKEKAHFVLQEMEKSLKEKKAKILAKRKYGKIII